MISAFNVARRTTGVVLAAERYHCDVLIARPYQGFCSNCRTQYCVRPADIQSPSIPPPAQIKSLSVVQASNDLPLCRDTKTPAARAEWASRCGYEAYHPAQTSPRSNVIRGRLAYALWNWAKLEALAQTFKNLPRRYEVLLGYVCERTDRHHFQKAHNAPARKTPLGYIWEFVVVQTSLNDHIDLDRCQAGLNRRLNAGDRTADIPATSYISISPGLEGIQGDVKA
jgi:hypothetical protein